jgi:hypothetical protein
MQNLIQVFSRQKLSEKYTPISGNTILLPSTLWEESQAICDGKKERAGWLICKKDFYGDHILYMVECIYVAFTGDTGSVFPDKRLRLEEQEYSIIEFHTHPEELGSTWHDQFSGGDISTLTKRLAENKTYKHVLFTGIAKRKPLHLGL